jgi:hypothetical protein
MLYGSSLHLIVISFIAYLIVNLFENLIHYNIGRFSDQRTHMELPTRSDWVKIVIVMCIFALLQGLLTYAFNKL